MIAYVLSDHDSIGARVRHALIRAGQDCPMGHVLPLEFAKQQVSRVKPDLVVVVLAPNPDAALTIPAELRGLVLGRILAVGPAADTRRVLDQLEQMDITGGRAMIVANRYGQAKQVTAGQAEAALGVKIGHFVPDDPKTINRANNTGVPVIIDAPKAKVTKSVLGITASVNGRHHP